MLSALAILLAGLPGMAAADGFNAEEFCPDPLIRQTGAVDFEFPPGSGEMRTYEWFICSPPLNFWNGGLVAFIPGSVAPPIPLNSDRTLGTVAGQLDFDDVNLPELVALKGFAFITFAHSVGPAIRESAELAPELVNIFTEQIGQQPNFSVLAGASAGGAAAALVAENPLSPFLRYVAACAPLEYPLQLRYSLKVITVAEFWFRPIIEQVINALKMGGVLPGDVTGLLEVNNGALRVPPSVVDNWPVFEAGLLAELAKEEHADKLELVQSCANIPTDPSEKSVLETIGEVVAEGTRLLNTINDAAGGNPVGNKKRFYHCPGNFIATLRLNRGVKRVEASGDPDYLEERTPKGTPNGPITVFFNDKDHRVPSVQSSIVYPLKALSKGSIQNVGIIPIDRFGHCNFTAEELAGLIDGLIP